MEYAEQVIYSEKLDGTQRYFGAPYFFNNVLQIWLELRRTHNISCYQQNDENRFLLSSEFEVSHHYSTFATASASASVVACPSPGIILI